MTHGSLTSHLINQGDLVKEPQAQSPITGEMLQEVRTLNTQCLGDLNRRPTIPAEPHYNRGRSEGRASRGITAQALHTEQKPREELGKAARTFSCPPPSAAGESVPQANAIVP